MPIPTWIFCLFYVRRMSNIPSASADVAAFCPVQLASYGSKLRPAGILAEEAPLDGGKKASGHLARDVFMRGAGVRRREGGGQMWY